MSTQSKTVFLYFPGLAVISLSVPASDIPGMQSAIASGSWWSPSNATYDHIDMSRIVRYTIAN